MMFKEINRIELSGNHYLFYVQSAVKVLEHFCTNVEVINSPVSEENRQNYVTWTRYWSFQRVTFTCVFKYVIVFIRKWLINLMLRVNNIIINKRVIHFSVWKNILSTLTQKKCVVLFFGYIQSDSRLINHYKLQLANK